MDALTYVSSREIIRRPEIDFVSLGVRWRLANVPSLDRFKESMGYRRIDFRERMEVCPELKLFFQSNRVCRLVGKLARKRFDKSNFARMMCWATDQLLEQRNLEISLKRLDSALTKTCWARPFKCGSMYEPNNPM